MLTIAFLLTTALADDHPCTASTSVLPDASDVTLPSDGLLPIRVEGYIEEDLCWGPSVLMSSSRQSLAALPEADSDEVTQILVDDESAPAYITPIPLLTFSAPGVWYIRGTEQGRAAGPITRVEVTGTPTPPVTDAVPSLDGARLSARKVGRVSHPYWDMSADLTGVTGVMDDAFISIQRNGTENIIATGVVRDGTAHVVNTGIVVDEKPETMCIRARYLSPSGEPGPWSEPECPAVTMEASGGCSTAASGVVGSSAFLGLAGLLFRRRRG